MRRYYIEFYNPMEDSSKYLLQTKWFDTEAEALEWYKENIDFKRDDIEAQLMSAETDILDDTYKDIIIEYNL